MADTKEKICRLCLNYESDNYSTLEASAIGKVKAIIPELILSYPNDTIVCSKCRNMLEKSFELKRTFSKNNDLVQSEKGKSGSGKVDLSKIVAGQGENICRICFIRNDGEYVSIDTENGDDFNQVLEYCIPELDINTTSKPVVCISCHDTLCEMYNFKKECLSVEEKIQACHDSTSQENVDLWKVVSLTRAEEENDFLSGFEVQDEEGTDIFDNIPNATADSHKRPASDLAVAEHIKRIKLTGEITDEELPPFQFSNNLLFNLTQSEIMVEDWLASVEEYKKKFNWSDYTTIHKVLVKLKSLRELYIWFSNIADIMDWEQWKQKLVRAFPRKTDYHIHLKRMVIRRKRKDETYVAYYTDKVQLMEPLELTGQQKVSCIFGGITDVLVCCIGRVGDYKCPEDLLDYFKSCDDKQTVEAESEGKKPFTGAQKSKDKGTLRTAAFQASADALYKAKLEKRKLKMKCFECGRLGHTAIQCQQFKIGDHMNRVDKLRVQNNPKANQALARHPKKIKCLVCGKFGHLASICRLRKQQPQLASGVKPPHRVIKSEERCSGCHKVGHSIDVCFKVWKNLDKPGSTPTPPRKPKPGKPANDNWSRCRDCGKYGSKLSPCCPARASNNGNYLGAYSAQSSYNKEICLRCYKMGHATKDCHEYARRSFRNYE